LTIQYSTHFANNLPKSLTPVQKKILATVILIIWTRLKTEVYTIEVKKGHLSASVFNRGISNSYYLDFGGNRGRKVLHIASVVK